MATVIQRPDTLSLLGNLKSYRINTSSEVSFKLAKGAVTVIEESYHPDNSNVVEIDIQEVVAQYIDIQLPTSEIFRQTNGVAAFSAYIDGDLIHSFTVICGGVRNLAISAADWLAANWLTWQPQTKRVRWNQPEYLSYYFTSSARVRAKFYPISGNPETVTIHTGAAGQLMSYNMEMAHLFSMSSHNAEDLNGLVDVWVETASGTRLSYIQRYVFSPVTRDEHYFMSVNSLGGIDTFCFTGAQALAPSINHEAAERSGRKMTITGIRERSWSQNTGYIGKTEAVWLWDFFASQKQWAIIEGNAEAIILDSSSIKASDKDNLKSSDFSFSLAQEGRLLKIVRTPEDFPAIRIQSPAGELFFLAPRVIDYPDANLEDSLLFLVQSPFVQEWKKISLATLKAWIQEIFTPYELLPLRLEIDTDGDNFLAWGESIHLTCKVWKGVYVDVTNDVTAWSISRNSGVPIEDSAWMQSPKARTFDGSIEICFKDGENDLGEMTTSTSTIFTIRAYIEDQTATAQIEI